MKSSVFVGKLASIPQLMGTGDDAYTRITQISNAFAAKSQKDKECEGSTIVLQFTAFRRNAERLAVRTRIGDQLIVAFHIETSGDREAFGHNCIVEVFCLVAPGKEARIGFVAQ